MVVYSAHAVIEENGLRFHAVSTSVGGRGLCTNPAFSMEVACNSKFDWGTDKSECAFHAVTMMHVYNVGSFFSCRIGAFRVM